MSPRAKAQYLKTNAVESPSGCWEWQGAKHRVGYGLVSLKIGGGRYAHRAMYESVISPIPKGMYVLHSCDNRICINPSHLFLGTHLDNIKDMHAKNRQRGGSMPNEKNPSVKFSNETIREIRDLHSSGVRFSQLKRQFCIGESQLCRVLKNESRKEI